MFGGFSSTVNFVIDDNNDENHCNHNDCIYHKKSYFKVHNMFVLFVFSLLCGKCRHSLFISLNPRKGLQKSESWWREVMVI